MRTQEKYQNFTDEQLVEILSKERENAALKIQVGFKNKGNTKKARDEEMQELRNQKKARTAERKALKQKKQLEEDLKNKFVGMTEDEIAKI